MGCVDHALHGHLLDVARQLVGLHHALVPHVLVLDDLQLLGSPTPGGPSLFPVLDSLARVCRHDLHVLPAEPTVDVADHNAGEPGLVPLPGHFPVGAAPHAAHDQVGPTVCCLLAGLATAVFTAPVT